MLKKLNKKIRVTLLAFIGCLSFNAMALIDPTMPSGLAKVAPSKTDAKTDENGGKLVLNSIMIRGTEKSVIINNKLYKIGDDVEGAMIADIGINLVSLSDGQSLTLFDSIIIEKEGK